MAAEPTQGRLVTCPSCNGSKGDPPDEPCERCGATGQIVARPLEAIASDLKRELNARNAADMKAKRHQEQADEAEQDRLEFGGNVKELQRELVATLEDHPVPA